MPWYPTQSIFAGFGDHFVTGAFFFDVASMNVEPWRADPVDESIGMQNVNFYSFCRIIT